MWTSEENAHLSQLRVLEPNKNPSNRIFQHLPALSSLTTISLLVALSESTLSIALPIITSELDGIALSAFWAGTAFFLTEGVFMAPLSTLSNKFGRLNIINFSIILMLIGSIICSTAKDMIALIVGRAVQGIGAGGIIVCVDISIAEMVPFQDRGTYYSIISASWAIGDVSGPLIAGLVAQKTSWRWIFRMNIPIALLSLVLTNFSLRGIVSIGSGTNKDGSRCSDWAGLFLLVSAATSFLLGLTWAGVLYPWSSIRTILPLALGGIGGIAFILFQTFILRPQFLRKVLNPVMFYALLTAFIHTIVVISLMYGLPLYFQIVQGLDPLPSAIQMIPYSACMAPFSALGAEVIKRSGSVRWVVRCGSVMTMLGSGLLILLDLDTKQYMWTLILLVIGCGLGLLYNSLIMLAQDIMEDDYATFAVSILNFFRHYGQAVGVAIIGTTIQNQTRVQLMRNPDLASISDEYSKDIQKLAVMLKDLPLNIRIGVASIFNLSLRTVWIIMCAVCVLPAIGSAFLRPSQRVNNSKKETSLQ